MATIAPDIHSINRADQNMTIFTLDQDQLLKPGMASAEASTTPPVDLQARPIDNSTSFTLVLVMVLVVAAFVGTIRAFIEHSDGQSARRAFVLGAGWAGYTALGGFALITLLALAPA